MLVPIPTEPPNAASPSSTARPATSRRRARSRPARSRGPRRSAAAAGAAPSRRPRRPRAAPPLRVAHVADRGAERQQHPHRAVAADRVEQADPRRPARQVVHQLPAVEVERRTRREVRRIRAEVPYVGGLRPERVRPYARAQPVGAHDRRRTSAAGRGGRSARMPAGDSYRPVIMSSWTTSVPAAAWPGSAAGRRAGSRSRR